MPGAGLTTAEELGLSSKADRITGINNGQQGYMREQDMPFRRMEIINDLPQRPPQVKFSDLQGSLSDSPVIGQKSVGFRSSR